MPGSPIVYTLGYQGRSLEEVLEIARSHGIEQLLDVRDHPASRKPGFTVEALTTALARIGIIYVPLPQLGCATESRHALWRGESKEAFYNDYRRRLSERPEAFARLLHRVRTARSVLFCLERDPSRCHRAVLVEQLRAEGISAQDL